MKKVSIIIPFYNCPYVDQAILSVLNQSYENIELIVVNDGSTKHTEKIYPFLHNIHLYIEKPNGGTGSALNEGIKNATGDYFAWLSSDDRFAPHKIQKQIQYMESTSADICHSAYAQIDERGTILTPSIGLHFQQRLPFLKKMKEGSFINGSTIMMKMDVFTHIGLFNESLLYTQDYDLWLRILRKYSFRYIHEPLVQYRLHESMGTKRFEKEMTEEIELVQQQHHLMMEWLILKELKKTIILKGGEAMTVLLDARTSQNASFENSINIPLTDGPVLTGIVGLNTTGAAGSVTTQFGGTVTVQGRPGSLGLAGITINIYRGQDPTGTLVYSATENMNFTQGTATENPITVISFAGSDFQVANPDDLLIYTMFVQTSTAGTGNILLRVGPESFNASVYDYNN
ncbi:glycosyltransferase [Bacillus sp. BHET2]|uniref:glycosyltransferase n=1 Tax=Bacillus sp. BHET2 TaxID=2583818 RepID=UPI00110F2890|nr:glycosyltransferase [Bacillus sp. BHET2]TMU84344.1 glycosyltransferase [Bacillus sp. BHET2]